jgi:hypothetical protein
MKPVGELDAGDRYVQFDIVLMHPLHDHHDERASLPCGRRASGSSPEGNACRLTAQRKFPIVPP